MQSEISQNDTVFVVLILNRQAILQPFIVPNIADRVITHKKRGPHIVNVPRIYGVSRLIRGSTSFHKVIPLKQLVCRSSKRDRYDSKIVKPLVFAGRRTNVKRASWVRGSAAEGNITSHSTKGFKKK